MKEPITALCLREVDRLFHPFLHRKIHLSSRLVMTRLTQGKETMEQRASYYGRRAAHQIGLIVTEPIAVNEAAAAVSPGMQSFTTGSDWRGWRRVCRAVHACDCRLAAQLCHAGMLRQAHDAAGPSGIDPLTLELRGESMSHARIREVVQAFGDAASLGRRIGFDAIVVQGGHDYLIDQFLRAETNKRNDEYGGDIVGRTRFASEVVHAVRRAAGRRFPVIFRFSIGMKGRRLAASPAELGAMLHPLCEAGVDIFACHGEGAHEPAFAGSPLSVAGWTRLLTGRPVIVEGGVGLVGAPLSRLARGLATGEYDLVAVGRALMADAEWGSKVRLGRDDEIHPFTPPE